MAGNKRWSAEDLKLLKKEYGITPVDQLAEKLGRTIDAVHWKASKTGVKFQPDDLIDIRERLIRIEETMSVILKELAAIKTVSGQHSQRLTERQAKFIRNNYMTMSYWELSDALGIDYYKVSSYLNYHYRKGNLQRKKDLNYITDEAIDFVVKNYEKMTLREMAEKTGFNVNQIANVMRKNGLSKKRGPKSKN